MPHTLPESRLLAIVLGCGEVGSAVALALHASGLSVALVDEVDPAWHRRGMAFTDAWYVGHADLGGESACFCASVKSIPSILGRRMIAATTWSWRGVANAMEVSVLVDALGRRRRNTESLIGRVPLTLGIGSGFATGENVDVAIELRGDALHPASGDRSIPSSADAPAADDSVASGRVVAVHGGRFMTDRRIADAVEAGEIVGRLGGTNIVAPVDGVLLGLTARGARIEPGDTLVEVDRLGSAADCHGVSASLRAVAASTRSALARLAMRAAVPAVALQD